MEAKQVTKYERHGEYFEGKLVLVEYWDDLTSDSRYGGFGIALAYEYRDKAARLVAESGYEVQRVLLDYPDYVVRVR